MKVFKRNKRAEYKIFVSVIFATNLPIDALFVIENILFTPYF